MYLLADVCWDYSLVRNIVTFIFLSSVRILFIILFVGEIWGKKFVNYPFVQEDKSVIMSWFYIFY